MARRAARRALLGDLLRGGGWGLLLGAVVSVLVLGLDKLLVWRLDPWMVLGVLLGGGVVLAAGWSGRRRWSISRGASAIDRTHNLRDRLGSGLELEGRASVGDPFAIWAVEEAEHASRGVDPARAVRVRPGWAWIAWPMVSAGAIVVGLYVPWLVRETASDGAQVRAVREEARGAVDRIEQAVRDVFEDAGIEDAASEEDLRELAALEEALARGESGADDATARAASVAERVADRLEREGESRAIADRELRERLAQDGESSGEGAEQGLFDALRAGDMDRAKEEMDRLGEAVDKMDAGERERLAQALEEFAEQIDRGSSDETEELEGRSPGASPGEDQAEEQQPGVADGSRRDERDLLRDRGLSEEAIDDLGERTDPADIAERLREEGMSDRQAERLTEELDRQRLERDARQEAEDRASDLSDGLRDAAESVREPEPADEEQPGSEPEAGGEEQPGSEPEAGGEEQPGSEPEAGGEEQPGSEPQSGSEEQPGSEPQSGGEEQPGGEPQAGGEEQPGSEPQAGGEEQPGSEPQAGGEEQPGSEPQAGGERVGEERPVDGGDGERPSKGAFERLREAIKSADELGQDAARSRERSEDLRRRAREVLGELSPNQREDLDKLARELADRRGERASRTTLDDLASRETESVDARPDDVPEGSRERVIAEWYGGEQAPRDAISRSDLVSEHLRGAAEGAREAIEQQRVPARYKDLLRRVYRRVEERSDKDPR